MSYQDESCRLAVVVLPTVLLTVAMGCIRSMAIDKGPQTSGVGILSLMSVGQVRAVLLAEAEPKSAKVPLYMASRALGVLALNK